MSNSNYMHKMFQAHESNDNCVAFQFYPDHLPKLKRKQNILNSN